MNVKRASLLAALAVAAVSQARADDFNEQFLAAACVPAVTGDAAPATVVTRTPNGIGVTLLTGFAGEATLLCQVDASESNYFNWLQIVAEDDSPEASAVATLYRQDIETPGPAEALYRVRTVDGDGLQIAFNNGLDDTLLEFNYLYWIEIRLRRTNPGAPLIIYSAGLMDVL